MKRIVSIFLSLLLIPTIFYSQTSTDCSAVTIVSSTNNGTNTVATYFEANGIRNGDDYYGSTIYYPQNTTSILASIIIIPGYANFESSIQNWGPFLASHGIVCMTIGTNSIFDLVNARKEALQDALISLKAENTRISSPLFNKLYTNKIALGGWSMGGGGAQLAAVEDSTIKAIIALCSWIDPAQLTINSLNHDSPILFFSGQIDAIAPPNTHANVHYSYTPNTTDKLLYEISLGGHTVANSPSGGQGEVGRMALSWLKKYLIEDSCYCPLLLDTPLTASVYQTNITCPIYGCIDPLACNYDPSAITDDGSCIFQDNPIANMSAYNYTLSFHWGCSGIIYNSEMEFDSSGSAVVNPGTVGATNVTWSLCDSVLTWVYTDGTQYTSTSYDNGTFIGTMLSGSGSSTGCFTLTPIIAGCLDSTSLLYNPQANVDDGSCCANYLRLNMYSSWPGGWSGGIYWTMMDDNGDTVISTALTYNSSTDSYHNVDYICIPDGCYTIVCSNGGGSGGISWTLKDDSTNATIVSGGCPFGPYISAIGTSCVIMGCTDPNANNYYPHANLDDGSCTYSCGAITGVYMSDIIHDRATFNWDNMNSQYCQVDQIRIRYREVGTSSWSTKTMGVPVGSGCNTSNTSKRILSLSANTTYEYKFKIWYCNASTVIWHADGTFTTLPVCDNVTNVTATPITTTKTQFCWDSVSTYAFVRLQYREDVPGSSFSNIGGMGVLSPTLCKEKNGLTPGLTYRVMWRTWCNPSGGPYRSPQWDGPVIWTQPSSIRFSDADFDKKILIRITDILGREVNSDTVIDKTTLFYIYDDGTVEKKIIIE